MQKGDKFSQSFTVSSFVYNSFIEAYRDKNPLHTDENFAKSYGFPGRVMHGNILNGFISYFIGECLPEKNVIIQAQQIKFALPVYINDKLYFHAEITDVFEQVNTIEFKYYFLNGSSKKVATGTIQIGILK